MFQYILDNIKHLKAEIPEYVTIVAAAKSRTPDEITAAMDAGIKVIGENYIQEAESARRALPDCGEWHFIGHLQLNKVKRAVELFDMIETVDNINTARAIDRQAAAAGKIMPILIEVNIGREPRKNGVLTESVESIACAIAEFPHVRLDGLMTMGPLLSPEEVRPFFVETRKLYEQLKRLGIPGADIRCLSMGMSDSYKVAIEEGANIIRLGTAIFGPRI
jgi:PLP dependent protein